MHDAVIAHHDAAARRGASSDGAAGKISVDVGCEFRGEGLGISYRAPAAHVQFYNDQSSFVYDG